MASFSNAFLKEVDFPFASVIVIFPSSSIRKVQKTLDSTLAFLASFGYFKFF
jgi:hypothetical protein